VRHDYCDVQLAIVRSWLSDQNYESTKGLVDDYFRSQFRGIQFDMLAARTRPDAIETDDLNAVRALSIGSRGHSSSGCSGTMSNGTFARS
jgi:hypothetical protein